MIEREPPAGQPAPAGGSARLALVLGAGGTRGLAHVGVLEGLDAAGVAPDALVGTSAGALVAAIRACLGWSAEEMARRGAALGLRAILEAALLRRRPRGALVRLIEELREADLDRLPGATRHLGITCWDLAAKVERFFVTGAAPAIAVGDAVSGSIAIPLLFPSRRVTVDGIDMRLTDGGLHAALPVARAFGPPIRAARVLAVDLGVASGRSERRLDHQARLARRWGARLRILRPSLARFGTLHLGRGGARELIAAGRRAVTPEVIDWCLSEPHLP